MIPTSLLSEMTKKHVTVALSGDAGDEVFGGYDTYLAYKIAKFIPNFSMKFLKKITKLIPASDKNLHISYKIKKFIEDYDTNINKRHLNWMSQTNEKIRKNILTKNFKIINSNIEGNNLLSSASEDNLQNYSPDKVHPGYSFHHLWLLWLE